MFNLNTNTLGSSSFPMCLINGHQVNKSGVRDYLVAELTNVIPNRGALYEEIQLYHADKIGNYSVGDSNEMYIFNKYTDDRVNPEGNASRNTQYGEAYKPVNQGRQFKDENGDVIAEHITSVPSVTRNDINMLYLYPNMLSTKAGLDKIVEIVNIILTDKWKINNASYKWSEKEDEAKEMLKDSFKENVMGRLRQKERDLHSANDNIEGYSRDLTLAHKRAVELRKEIANHDSDLDTTIEKVNKDLDLILTIPEVVEVELVKNKIMVKTKPIVIHDDKKGRLFQGGEYTLILDISDNSTKFNTTVRRRSYWSSNDMHPHISKSGNACFGNIESTLIELFAQSEFYALTLSLIDFISSANISDPAGACVVYWDEINEDGDIVNEGRNPSYSVDENENNEYDWVCDECGNEQYDDAGTWVYGEVLTDEDGEYIDEDTEHRVCDYCLANHYHYNDNVDMYVRD